MRASPLRQEEDRFFDMLKRSPEASSFFASPKGRMTGLRPAGREVLPPRRGDVSARFFTGSLLISLWKVLITPVKDLWFP